MPKEIPTIRTERLALRPFEARDAAPLYEILRQKDILTYFPSQTPPEKEKVAIFIQRQLDQWEEIGYAWWAVTLAADAEAVILGWQGLQYLPDTDEVEVGYLLSRKHWGHGYATEGARASLAYGFETLNVDEIVGIVHPENIASQRVLEKAGMGKRVRTEYFGMDVFRYQVNRE